MTFVLVPRILNFRDLRRDRHSKGLGVFLGMKRAKIIIGNVLLTLESQQHPQIPLKNLKLQVNKMYYHSFVSVVHRL